jgi:hypothetical protein
MSHAEDVAGVDGGGGRGAREQSGGERGDEACAADQLSEAHLLYCTDGGAAAFALITPALFSRPSTHPSGEKREKSKSRNASSVML